MLANNALALAAAFGLALVWLRINDFFAQRGWISSFLSRKIIHIGTGPLFVITWLLFDGSLAARFLAALIPLAITIQFTLVGLGVIRDPAAVKAMSRTGDQREILRGPLFYGIVFVVLTLVYWRETPIGIVALMMLCGGDGLAEIAGRKWGKRRLPWSPGKSWAGLAAMLFGGWLFSMLVIAVYLAAGAFPGPLRSYIPAVSLIALAATAVESLPLADVDNLTIPLVAALLGHLLFA
jgi:phytol kinase